MPKQLKIIEHEFSNKGIKRIVKKEVDKLEHLKFRINSLEEQLSRIIKLVETLDYFKEESNLFSDTDISIAYDKTKVNKIKKYLSWVLHMLKDNQGLYKFNKGNKAQYIGNQLIKNFNHIEKSLAQGIFYNSASGFSLRNRTGRTAEHVGNSPTMFDYGSFLEEGITFHDCFVYGSGFYFYPSEIVYYIKQANPSFLSKAILISLNLHRICLPGYNFREISNSILNNIITLIPQACCSINIENLKALTMLYDMTLTQNNFSLSYQILSMTIRMGYSLGIDKIQLDNESMLRPYTEYKQLVELKKLWSMLFISASVIINLVEFPLLLNCYSITKSDLNHFTSFEVSEMNNSNINHNSCKNVFTFISYQSMMMISIILEHLQSIDLNQVKLKQVPYSYICLPSNKFNEIQAFINKYYITSPNFVHDEAKCQSRNKSIEVEKYLCRFPNNYLCNLKTIHETRKSLSVYFLQIFLIYPLILRIPYQVNIPLNKSLIMLEASLKILLIYRAMAYIYFETILSQMEPSINGENKNYDDISKYLNVRPRPLIKDKTEYYFYVMRIHTFRGPLYTFYALLQILSSQEYYNSGLASNESIAIVKTNIIELIEIYKLGYKLKDNLARMDIDFTIDKVKKAVHNFHILPEYQIDWFVLLNGFETKL